MEIYHFSGAGNDFVVIDGREGDVSAFREVATIEALCKEYKTDGLMILGREMPGQAGHDENGQAGHDENGQAGHDGKCQAGHDGRASVMADSDRPSVDFVMEFYNPDGSGGMMCGNGGRCIVAFADYLGIRPGERFLHSSGARNDSASQVYLFRAPDGLHTGEILGRPEENLWEVRIKMIDVQGITPMLGGYFLNTGTRHFVKFVEDVEQVDIDTEGRALRWNEAFAPVGTNVNFVHVAPDGLHVRTFEKGVEGETLACGTGLTASAIAAYQISRLHPVGSARNDNTPVISTKAGGRVEKSYRLRARQDWLSVNFTPGADEKFTDVYLTGPARLVEIL